MNIIAKKGNDEISEQATEAIQKSFDSYIQIAYDIANEEERDLIRKLRYLAKAKNKSVEEIKAICASLHEFNPMMGHRGCRLAVTYPEIAKMQTKAVIRAAINTKKVGKRMV